MALVVTSPIGYKKQKESGLTSEVGVTIPTTTLANKTLYVNQEV